MSQVAQYLMQKVKSLTYKVGGLHAPLWQMRGNPLKFSSAVICVQSKIDKLSTGWENIANV